MKMKTKTVKAMNAVLAAKAMKVALATKEMSDKQFVAWHRAFLLEGKVEGCSDAFISGLYFYAATSDGIYRRKVCNRLGCSTVKAFSRLG